MRAAKGPRFDLGGYPFRQAFDSIREAPQGPSRLNRPANCRSNLAISRSEIYRQYLGSLMANRRRKRRVAPTLGAAVYQCLTEPGISEGFSPSLIIYLTALLLALLQLHSQLRASGAEFRRMSSFSSDQEGRCGLRSCH